MPERKMPEQKMAELKMHDTENGRKKTDWNMAENACPKMPKQKMTEQF